MIQEPRYMFIIKDGSSNLYEFQDATERAYENYENDVGRCRFFIPNNDLKLSSSSVPGAAYSEILIYRNETLVWQGIVQIVQDTSDGTWVYGETFMAALGWYGVRYDQAYSATAVGTIITNEYDNIETRTGNFLTAKITQGTIQTPYQTSTSNDLTITRTLYNDNFLEFLKEMVAVARGEMTAAWDQNTVFNISFSATAPTFTFTRNVGSDKADVIFEMDSEIIDFSIPSDNRYIYNSVKGFAVQEGPKVLTKTSTDTTSRTSWYLRENYPYYGTATSQTDLDQRNDDFLAEAKDPNVGMSLKFVSGIAPLDGYSMGDSVKIRINTGRISIDEYRRVIGYEVDISNNGIENTKLLLQKERT